MREQMGTLLRGVLCSAMLAVMPGVAHSDDGALARPTDPIADQYRIAGNALVGAHEYDAAIDVYRKGYARDRWPLFHYNIGLAQRANGDCRGALESFHRFLEAASSAATAYRDAVEVQVPNARDHIAELEKVCPRPPQEHRYKLPAYRRPFVLAGVSVGIAAGAVGGVLLWYADRSTDRARDAARGGTLEQFDDAIADARSQRNWGTGLVGLGAGFVVSTFLAHWLSPRWMSELRLDTGGEHIGASIGGAF